MSQKTCQACFHLNPPRAERCVACGAHMKKRRRRRGRAARARPRPPLLKGPSSAATRARRLKRKQTRKTGVVVLVVLAVFALGYMLTRTAPSTPEPTRTPTVQLVSCLPDNGTLLRDHELEEGAVIFRGRLALAHADSLGGLVVRAPGARDFYTEPRADSSFAVQIRLWPGRNELNLNALCGSQEIPVKHGPLVLFRDATSHRGAELLAEGRAHDAREALQSALELREELRAVRPLTPTELREELGLFELLAQALATAGDAQELHALLERGGAFGDALASDSSAFPTRLGFIEACALGLQKLGFAGDARTVREQAFEVAAGELDPSLSLARQRYAAARRLELSLQASKGELASDEVRAQSLRTLEDLYPDGAEDGVARRALSLAGESLGMSLVREAGPAAGRSLLERSAAQLLALLRDTPGPELAERGLHYNLRLVGEGLMAEGDAEAGLALLDLSSQVLLQLIRSFPAQARFVEECALLAAELAELHTQAGHSRLALRYYRLHAANTQDLMRRGIVTVEALAEHGRAALTRASQTIAELESLLGAGPIDDQELLARVELSLGHLATCLSLCQAVRMVEPEHRETLVCQSEAWAAKGQLSRDAGDLITASLSFEEEVALRRKLVEAEPRNRSYLRNLATALRDLASTCEADGQAERAAELRRESHEIYPDE